jgi:hypothetical protein
MSVLPRSRRLAALLAAACVALLGGYAVSQASLPTAGASGGFGGFGGGPPGAAQSGPPPTAP